MVHWCGPEKLQCENLWFWPLNWVLFAPCHFEAWHRLCCVSPSKNLRVLPRKNVSRTKMFPSGDYEALYFIFHPRASVPVQSIRPWILLAWKCCHFACEQKAIPPHSKCSFINSTWSMGFLKLPLCSKTSSVIVLSTWKQTWGNLLSR